MDLERLVLEKFLEILKEADTIAVQVQWNPESGSGDDPQDSGDKLDEFGQADETDEFQEPRTFRFSVGFRF